MYWQWLLAVWNRRPPRHPTSLTFCSVLSFTSVSGCPGSCVCVVVLQYFFQHAFP